MKVLAVITAILIFGFGLLVGYKIAKEPDYQVSKKGDTGNGKEVENEKRR